MSLLLYFRRDIVALRHLQSPTCSSAEVLLKLDVV